MSKQKKSTSVFITLRVAVIAAAVFAVVGFGAAAHADKFDEQIKSLKAQNNSTAGVVNGLTAQANSYQAVIDQKQSQINALESQIYANQSKQSQLQSQIDTQKQQINQKKASLSADIKSMYIDGQMSTIEELATSKDLSDYVDKEEYRTAVQNQLNTKIKEIAALQVQLQSQKKQVDEVIATTQAQNNQLSAEKGAQDKLLAYTEGQRSAYNSQISSNNTQIDALRRQQLAANSRFISGGSAGAPGTGPTCGGGYPSVWCNAAQDSIIDSWGMYNRECVSYTAFKVAASGRHMPYWGGRGNANQWDDNARAAGIPVDGNPRVGDVAISNSGAYGHAMYVEGVNGSTIFVSQYNAALDGRYSTTTISKGSLVFIHF